MNVENSEDNILQYASVKDKVLKITIYKNLRIRRKHDIFMSTDFQKSVAIGVKVIEKKKEKKLGKVSKGILSNKSAKQCWKK